MTEDERFELWWKRSIGETGLSERAELDVKYYATLAYKAGARAERRRRRIEEWTR